VAWCLLVKLADLKQNSEIELEMVNEQVLERIEKYSKVIQLIEGKNQ